MNQEESLKQLNKIGTLKMGEEEDQQERRWEYLYKLAKIKKEQREILQEQAKKEKEEKEINCTFKPQLQSQYELKKDLFKLPFNERQKLWQEQKVDKIQQQKEENKDKDIKGLSFKPNLTQYIQPQPDDPTEAETKGIETFIRRQTLARQYKKQKKLLEENPYAHLSGEKKGFVGREKTTLADAYENRIKKNRSTFSTTLLSSGKKSTSIKEQESPVSNSSQKEIKVTMGNAIKILHQQLHNIDFSNQFK